MSAFKRIMKKYGAVYELNTRALILQVMAINWKEKNNVVLLFFPPSTTILLRQGNDYCWRREMREDENCAF